MIEALGNAGTFGIFSICSIIGGIYLSIMMKSTEGLGKEELSVLYYPEYIVLKEELMKKDLNSSERHNLI